MEKSLTLFHQNYKLSKSKDENNNSIDPDAMPSIFEEIKSIHKELKLFSPEYLIFDDVSN